MAILFALCSPTEAGAVSLAEDLRIVYSEADYQTNLPGINEPLPRASEEDSQDEEDEPRDVDALLRLILFVLKWLAILAAAAAGVYGTLAAVRAWRRRQRKPRRTDLVRDNDVVALRKGRLPPAAKRFALAERLAEQGAYGAAIHALLLDVIDALFARSDRPVPHALTARELIALVPLDDTPRRDFAGLVARSERSHFGGLPADRAAFDACYLQAVRLVGAMVRT